MKKSSNRLSNLYRVLAVVLICVLLLSGCAGGKAATASVKPQPEYKMKKATGGALEAKADAVEQLPPLTLSTRPIYQVLPPELLARVDSAELKPLPLIAQDVSVVVAGHRARVVMDLVFQNPSAETLDGTFMIELPDRASPCYLGMFLGEGVEETSGTVDPGTLPALLNPEPARPEALLAPEISLPARWETGQVGFDWGGLRSAEVVEPIKEREVYEAVNRRPVEPAPAGWAGRGAFSARISPIPPQGFRRVVFAYDQTLVPTEDRIRFPLPVLAGELRNSRLVVHDVSTAFKESSVSLGQNRLGAERTPQGFRWTVEPGSGPEESALFQAVLRNPVFSTLVGQDSSIPGTLISLAVAPILPQQAIKMPTGKALFILDTSYSSREAFLSLSGQLLRHILSTDDSLEEFAILCFDVRTTLLTPGYVVNTEEARKHYFSLIEQIWLEGATSFESVLEALSDQPDLQRADTIFLLSDGQITWGIDSPSLLNERFAEILQKRWICYNIGTRPHNRRLFEALTRKNGRIVYASGGQDLLDTARAHRYPAHRLDAVFSAMNDEVIVAGDPKLLYPGQVLEIAVRLRRPSSALRLVLQIDGRNMEMIIPLQPSPLSEYLAARSWAEVYVGRLLEEPDDNAVQAIYSLSRYFGLSNDYARFIILETEEEYRRYGIAQRGRGLDFSRVNLLLRLRRAAGEDGIHLLSGMSIPDDLGETPAQIVASLTELETTPVWSSPQPLSMSWDPNVLLEELQGAKLQAAQPPSSKPPSSRLPVEHPRRDTPMALYLLAGELFTEARALHESPVPTKEDPEIAMAGAFRVLSTIAEVRPKDERSLRLLGFVLMEWGLYGEAERTFARVRWRRPFEPQNLLLEGVAQAAQGKLGEAALRYEIVLRRPSPRFEEYVKPAARRLYADLLEAALSVHEDSPDRELWEKRQRELRELEPERKPKGRLLLFWNLDNTDVDLHVREGVFTRVWYEKKSSISGGRLFWDNTEGLGPELYEHPRLSRRGFKVSVNYFSSSSVEGGAPVAAFVAAFTYRTAQTPPYASWHTTVLAGIQEEKAQVMPRWKRVK